MTKEEEASLKLMVHGILSRRRFIENSLSSGLAVGWGLGVRPLSAAAAAIPSAEGLSLKVTDGAAQEQAGIRTPEMDPDFVHSRERI